MTPLRLAVVGDPIEHSLSPLIHSAALAWHHIEGSYERIRCGPEAMPEIAGRLLGGDLHGVNVTMPNKAAAFESCAVRTEAALRCGAVNTLWVEGGRLHGDITDVGGIAWAWERSGLPPDGPVAVLGAGGAAAAALVALADREVLLTARRPSAAEALAERVGTGARLHPWGAPLGEVAVANATPIGMAGEELPGWVIDGATGLLDMTYGSGHNPARARLAAAGLPTAGGEEMLVGQAALSFARWTGVEPPHAVMLAALETAESGE